GMTTTCKPLGRANWVTDSAARKGVQTRAADKKRAARSRLRGIKAGRNQNGQRSSSKLWLSPLDVSGAGAGAVGAAAVGEPAPARAASMRRASASASTGAVPTGGDGPCQNSTLLAKLSSDARMPLWSDASCWRMAGSAFCTPAAARKKRSPGLIVAGRVDATVAGSALKRAFCADWVGSIWLVGAVPGAGGFRLKSGGMTRGALETTANSSGESLPWPEAKRSCSQPESATAAPAAKTRARRRRECMGYSEIFP